MKNIFLLFTALALALSVSAQKKIGGVSVPNTFAAGTTTLTLNGAGIREKYWFDLYVGALYLEAKSTNGSEIANADKPMAVRLHIISSKITRSNMTEAINEGFTASTKGNISPIKSRIDQLLNAFTGEIKIGDIFDLVYEPGKGVSLYKNSQLATTVTGLDFKKALFGIWLGPAAVDSDLKEGMLGLD